MDDKLPATQLTTSIRVLFRYIPIYKNVKRCSPKSNIEAV